MQDGVESRAKPQSYTDRQRPESRNTFLAVTGFEVISLLAHARVQKHRSLGHADVHAFAVGWCCGVRPAKSTEAAVMELRRSACSGHWNVVHRRLADC